MERDLAAYHAFVTDIAYCPHRPDEGCSCRKPQAEMLFRLAKKHQINLKGSYMVGDRAPDIKAGKNAGTKTVLISSREKADADYIFSDLFAFAKWLIGR